MAKDTAAQCTTGIIPSKRLAPTHYVARSVRWVTMRRITMSQWIKLSGERFHNGNAVRHGQW